MELEHERLLASRRRCHTVIGGPIKNGNLYQLTKLAANVLGLGQVDSVTTTSLQQKAKQKAFSFLSQQGRFAVLFESVDLAQIWYSSVGKRHMWHAIANILLCSLCISNLDQTQKARTPRLNPMIFTSYFLLFLSAPADIFWRFSAGPSPASLCSDIAGGFPFKSCRQKGQISRLAKFDTLQQCYKEDPSPS